MASSEDSTADFYTKAADAMCAIARRYADAGYLGVALRVLDIAERLTAEADAPPAARVGVLVQQGRVLIYVRARIAAGRRNEVRPGCDLCGEALSHLAA